MIRGLHLILPGGAGYTNLSLGFPHRAQRYRPPFLSPMSWSVRCMEGFMIWEWHIILPAGWRWPYEPQVGIPHRHGGIDPGDHCFRSPFAEVAHVWNDF